MFGNVIESLHIGLCGAHSSAGLECVKRPRFHVDHTRASSLSRRFPLISKAFSERRIGEVSPEFHRSLAEEPQVKMLIAPAHCPAST